MRENLETTAVLEKIRHVFAAARPEGVGRINNGLLAGVLGELIDRRRVLHPWEVDESITFHVMSKEFEDELNSVLEGGFDQRVEENDTLFLRKGASKREDGDEVDRAGAWLKMAMGEFTARVRDRIGPAADPGVDVVIANTLGSINELIDVLVRATREESPQIATPPGDAQPGLSDEEREAIEGAGGIVSD